MRMKRRHYLHVDPSRAAKGEKNGNSKLTSEKVIEIRKIALCVGITQRELAAEYGVCQRTINKIINQTGWVSA